MRKSLGVCLITLLLTCPVVAGEMPNDKPAPPPQPASYVQEPTDTTQDPATGGEVSDGSADSLTQIALELLAVLL